MQHEVNQASKRQYFTVLKIGGASKPIDLPIKFFPHFVFTLRAIDA